MSPLEGCWAFQCVQIGAPNGLPASSSLDFPLINGLTILGLVRAKNFAGIPES